MYTEANQLPTNTAPGDLLQSAFLSSDLQASTGIIWAVIAEVIQSVGQTDKVVMFGSEGHRRSTSPLRKRDPLPENVRHCHFINKRI